MVFLVDGQYNKDIKILTMIPDWLNLTQLSGNSGVTTISVDVPYNLSYANRTTNITVATIHTNMSEGVNITQLGQEDTGGTDYTEQYFTIEITSGSNLKLNLKDKKYYYKKNNGNWIQATSSAITVTNGDIIKVKGNYTELTNGLSGATFNLSGTSSSIINSKIYGNILSLIYSDDFLNYTSFDKNYLEKIKSRIAWGSNNTLPIFTNLKVIDAENVIYPSNTYNGCYYQMFINCSLLQKTPKVLPANTLSQNCYGWMFRGCTSLTGVPSNMLPATTLASGCYKYMFWKCTSLTNAPDLPATIVYPNCYYGMFDSCTSLTTAPNLPATEGYSPCGCYFEMFNGCTSLTTAPLISLKTIYGDSYSAMFSGCTSLNYIKCLSEIHINDNGNVQEAGYRTNWVSGVAASGTFVKASGVTWESGDNGIPTGWTVQEV